MQDACELHAQEGGSTQLNSSAESYSSRRHGGTEKGKKDNTTRNDLKAELLGSLGSASATEQDPGASSRITNPKESLFPFMPVSVLSRSILITSGTFREQPKSGLRMTG